MSEPIMTWEAAAQIFCTTLQNGTFKGRRVATEAIVNMGKSLDRVNVALAEAGESDDPIEVMRKMAEEIKEIMKS